jgi:hypothetical protein
MTMVEESCKGYKWDGYLHITNYAVYEEAVKMRTAHGATLQISLLYNIFEALED